MSGTPILHVDMDAFYAAVEVLDDPTLAGRPLIVGGDGKRGVVASCSYEARAYGIRSAMPSVRARRLCPHAVFRPGRHGRYAEVSAALHGVLTSYTPLVEGISLDEAFLDVGGAERLFGDAPAIAAGIRARVAEELHLACSVGVARSKFVAKLGSRAAKPTSTLAGVVPGPGVVVIEPAAERAFLDALPVEAVWGVGPATAARLHRVGITTVAALARVSPAALESAVGRATGAHLLRLAGGLDDRPVVPNQAPKSVGHEETWATDRHDPADVRRQAVRMADAVGTRLRRHALVGRTVTIKVRFGDFTTITRSHTLPSATDTGQRIGAVASELLAGVDVGPGVRLLGVSIANLTEPDRDRGEQLALGDDSGDRDDDWEAATAALDAIRSRFGDAAVGPGALLDRGSIRVRGVGDAPWGPAGGGPT